MTTPLPIVSVLLMAHQHERFVVEAIESVLAQDYPRERLDLVLVDDASTDDTWSLVTRYADDLRAVRTHTGDVVATASRCVEEAHGELVCFLSCDDAMHPHRVRAGVTALAARPEVSLVCGEADRIDAHGAPEGRFIADVGLRPPLPDQRGALLSRQPICAPTAMMRTADLRRHMPVSDVCPWEDWWIYVRLMQEGLVWSDPEPLVRYRRHDGNLYNGASWTQALRLRLREIPWMRHLLCAEDDDGITTGELVAAAANLLDAIGQIEREGIAPPEVAAPVSEDDRFAGGVAHARALELLQGGDPDAAARMMSRAIGHDPLCQAMRFTIMRAEGDRRRRAATVPVQTRGDVVIARWGELRRRPWLLEAYAAAFGPGDDVTLAIDAEGWSPSRLRAELLPLAAELGLDDGGPDVVVLPPGHQQAGPPLPGRTVAALTDDHAVAVWAGAPAAAEVDALRARRTVELKHAA